MERARPAPGVVPALQRHADGADGARPEWRPQSATLRTAAAVCARGSRQAGRRRRATAGSRCGPEPPRRAGRRRRHLGPTPRYPLSRGGACQDHFDTAGQQQARAARRPVNRDGAQYADRHDRRPRFRGADASDPLRAADRQPHRAAELVGRWPATWLGVAVSVVATVHGDRRRGRVDELAYRPPRRRVRYRGHEDPRRRGRCGWAV